ncbi:MAG TPA: response regulator [Rickettsiales bacterium]|nr:response regulator [Rickettsiales bacterium]
MKQQNKQNIKIILIEDDAGHAELLIEGLKDVGLKNEVIHFSDGGKAIEEITNPKSKIYPAYVMIFLDLNLPGVDGYTVLKKLKADKFTNKIPISILTTTDNQSEVDKCYELGCNMYITKPVDYKDFKDVLEKISTIVSTIKVPEIIKGKK